MRRVCHAACLLLFLAAPGFCEQGGKAAKTAPPREELLRPGAPKGGVPKVTPKAPAPRIANPTSPAAHLYKLSPEQRDRALEKLPFAMQQRLRRELQRFDQLPKEEQELRIRQIERFDSLTPEKQMAFRARLQALASLDQDRRRQVTAALRRLHNALPGERARILARPAFQARFTPEEFQIITTLAEVMLPPN